jgi:hypothetical protein
MPAATGSFSRAVVRLFVVLLALGVAGGVAPIASAVAPATSTTLAVAPNPANAGDEVTLTAVVTASSGGAPTGVVRFAEGLEADVHPISATSSRAVVSTRSFASTTAITATFVDSTYTFATSQSPPVTLTVRNVQVTPTKLTLTGPASIAPDSTAEFVATVATTTGTPVTGGDVIFEDNGVLLGTAPLDAAGVARVQKTGFVAGSNVITASYSGNATYGASAGTPLVYTVPAGPTRLDTTITASITPNPISPSETATLSAHVVQTGGTASPPGGEVVTFTRMDGANEVFVAEAPLDANGNATVQKGSWLPGRYTITASYVGDATYKPARTPLTLDVLPSTTQVVHVTAPSASMTYGGPLPALVATYDSATQPTTPATCTANATATSPVGTYSVHCSGAAAANAVFRYGPDGTLTITPAPLTVKANDVTLAAGQAMPTFTATLTGFVNSETLATSGVTGIAVCTTTATSASAAGTYPITCTQGSLSATNYTFGPYVGGTLTITASDCSRWLPAWRSLGVARDDDEDARRPSPQCESLLSGPTPASGSTVAPGQTLTIVYGNETPLRRGPAAAVAALGAARLLPVTVTPLAGTTSAPYRSLISVTLPRDLPSGPVTVFLFVRDSDGDVDLVRWQLTVVAPPSSCTDSKTKSKGRGDDDERCGSASDRRNRGSIRRDA